MKIQKILRILSLALSLILICSFAACDNGGNNSVGDSSSSEIESETNNVASEGKESAGVESVETDSESENDTETETEGETSLILGEDVEYASSFTVSKVFGDNMIIQRNEYIRIWGWADESENGKKVSASFMGNKADGLIENGAWEIVICAKLDANTEKGNNLVVTNGSTETVFHDVLVGDVFMVIGQSNIQYDIDGYISAEKDLKWTKDELSADSIIRVNYNSNKDNVGYPTRGTTEECLDVVTPNGWVIPDAENIGRLSAIGYFIAHQIAELTENKIPVGIAQFSASGRPLSVFMPNELADSMGTDRFDEAQGIYMGKVHESVVTRYMYNHYIKPYERMPIAGIVWYQGEAESPAGTATVFVERFTALMNYMRNTHNLVNKEFPVFLVEMPSIYRVEGSGEYLDTGRIRATQGGIPMSLTNSYIAVGSDLWNDRANTNNVHPYCKYEQAERVSALIDAVVYGGQTVDKASGPILKSYEIAEDGKTIVLKFENYGEGLTTSDGGTNVTGIIQVSRKNSLEKRFPVVATITAPDTVTITCEKAMSGVAYHAISEMYYGDDINLCDSDGTPAAAFWVYEK